MIKDNLNKPYVKLLLGILGGLTSVLIILGLVFFIKPSKSIGTTSSMANASSTVNAKVATKPQTVHVKTPKAVKAIYMSSWVGSTKDWRQKLVDFINTSEVNALVIDVKDYSGYVSFITGDPEIAKLGLEENRIKDMKAFIELLHSHNIYVIGRVTVFQDPVYSQKFPSQAVQTQSGKVWKDKHDLSYVDPSSKPFWNYIVRIARACESIGFDEINFDYIRFPTDGNMADMKFPLSGPLMAQMKPKPILLGKDSVTLQGRVTGNARGVSANLSLKGQIMDKFYTHLHNELGSGKLGVPISADLFGLVTYNRDDLNIGQVLEVAAKSFDYIAPMVYPSHYPRGFKNYSNPADHPYEIIDYAMKTGAERLESMGYSRNKLRPWIQDFNLGAKYDAAKVKAQMKAVYDNKLNSWMVWDPRNKYTRDAYAPAKPEIPTVSQNK